MAQDDKRRLIRPHIRLVRWEIEMIQDLRYGVRMMRAWNRASRRMLLTRLMK